MKLFQTRLFRIILLTLVCLASLLLVTSCGSVLPEITGISVKETGSTEVLINRFKAEDYTLVIDYTDGSTKEIPLTEDMIGEDDYLDVVMHQGKHTLNITYKSFTCTYDVTVKQYEFSDVFMEDQTVTYDGEYHSLSVTGNVPVDSTVEFQTKNSYKDAGEYVISAEIRNENYLSTVITGVLVIEKANYDATALSFEDATFDYDGQEKEIAVSGLFTGLEVTYSIGQEKTNKAVNAGVYTVVAHFGSTLNYNQIDDMQATLTINKATYDMSGYTFADKTVTYTGDPFDMRITNESSLPDGVTVSYSGLGFVNAGQYVVTATFSCSDNYEPIPEMTATLTVEKAQISLTGVYMDGETIVYDGKEHIIEYTGTKPSSFLLTGYSIADENGSVIYDSTDASLSHKAVNAGTYTVYAHFSYRDTKNYEAVEPISAVLIIDKADISDITIENEIHEYKKDTGQSLTVKSSVAGLIATPSETRRYDESSSSWVEIATRPIDPGNYEITYTFDLTGDAAVNYNTPDSVTRTLTITKKNVSSSVSTKYEQTYTGSKIAFEPSISVESWITPSFYVAETVKQANGSTEEVYTSFDGATEPGAYLVFIQYQVNKLRAPANYADYYEIPERDTTYFVIKKRDLTITDDMFSSLKMTYRKDVKQEVVLNTNTLATKIVYRLEDTTVFRVNPGLSESDITVTYTNNKNSEVGYYTGTANISIGGDSAKYYNSDTTYTFHYAIKSGGVKTAVNVSVVQNTFDYDGETHGVVLSDIPNGIVVSTEQTNALIEPGSQDIYFTFRFENDIAEWLYDLSGLTSENKLYTTLIVNKIDYVVDLPIQTLTYNGQNQEVTLTPQSGIIYSDIIYESEERVNVGIYAYSFTVTLTNTELLQHYKETSTQASYFIIERAQYEYYFTNQNCAYNGQKQYIGVNVKNLDENVCVDTGTYSKMSADERKNVYLTWSKTGDGQVNVGTYEVTVAFTNYSQNYTFSYGSTVLNNYREIVTMTISETQADSSELTAYNTDERYYSVWQNETLSYVWSQLLNSEAFTITYDLDYFFYDKGTMKLWDSENTALHKADTQSDYTFLQVTESDQFVMIEYTIAIKDGYVDSSGTIAKGTPYHGYLRIRVTGFEETSTDGTASAAVSEVVDGRIARSSKYDGEII